MSINILFGVMSGNRLFIFYCPIICKTVHYIDQLENSSWCVYLILKTRLISDWSVENMNPDVNSNKMLLELLVYCKTKYE